MVIGQKLQPKRLVCMGKMPMPRIRPLRMKLHPLKKLFPGHEGAAAREVEPEPMAAQSHDALMRERARVAKKYLRGDGIEIGALHNPLPVPAAARVQYVDRMTRDELKSEYPELADTPLVEIDLLDDGELLATIRDHSQDFVIANHFLEHCQNPLLALRNMLRVLRPGGLLYVAIPDMRFTFDRNRPVTPIEHLLRDFEEGPAWSKPGHYWEWVTVVQEVKDEEWAKHHSAELARRDYSIHFHVWTQAEMFQMFDALRHRLHQRFEIELFEKNGEECLFVVKTETV